jgi:hypothetical protein
MTIDEKIALSSNDDIAMAGDDYDVQYVAELLKRDAKRRVDTFRSSGVSNHRDRPIGTRLNDKFLKGLVKKQNAHNVGLAGKEKSSSRTLLKALKREDQAKRTTSDSRLVHKVNVLTHKISSEGSELNRVEPSEHRAEPNPRSAGPQRYRSKNRRLHDGKDVTDSERTIHEQRTYKSHLRRNAEKLEVKEDERHRHVSRETSGHRRRIDSEPDYNSYTDMTC